MVFKANFAAALLSLGSGLALAQNAPPAGGPPGGPPPQNPACANLPKLDQRPLFKALDPNHTGRITRQQWEAAFGKTGTLFQDMDSKHQGYLTLDELQASSPPRWVDTNHDGKIEFSEEKAALAQLYAPGAKAPPHTGC